MQGACYNPREVRAATRRATGGPIHRRMMDVSDQEFFFDEEEDAKPKSTKAAASKRDTVSRAAPVARSGSASFFEQNVSMTVAALMTVIGLLLGVIIGVLIPAGPSTTPVTSPTGGSISAPALTDDQLNSGELPPGHPDISGMTGGAGGSTTTTATGSQTTTP